MGAFTTKKTLYGNASQIPDVAEQIRQAFAADGYEVRIDNPATGQEIYITKVVSLRRHWDFVQH